MRSLVILTAAMLASGLSAQAPTASGPAKVGGPVADFDFPKFVNGDGRQKMSDFYGQVMLIDFWGNH